jgi:sulfoxide reductase heme-binding subunit YedZ
VVDQNFKLGTVVSEIVLRFYLTIGFITVLGLSVLGVTSTDAWTHRLGYWWKRTHRALYVLAVVALLHYFLQSKSNVSEPVFFSGLFVWLMLWRALPMTWRHNVLALLALTVVATCATAGIEFGWYALATAINPWRVFVANESISFGLRPAHYVALMGLGVTLLSVLRRIGGKWRPRSVVPRSVVSRAID